MVIECNVKKKKEKKKGGRVNMNGNKEIGQPYFFLSYNQLRRGKVDNNKIISINFCRCSMLLFINKNK